LEWEEDIPLFWLAIVTRCTGITWRTVFANRPALLPTDLVIYRETEANTLEVEVTITISLTRGVVHTCTFGAGDRIISATDRAGLLELPLRAIRGTLIDILAIRTL
jgi:hypothetical protein